MKGPVQREAGARWGEGRESELPSRFRRNPEEEDLEMPPARRA